jgi:hypothetical protein
MHPGMVLLVAVIALFVGALIALPLWNSTLGSFAPSLRG